MRIPWLSLICTLLVCLASSAAAQEVLNYELSPASPATLNPGEKVYLDFDYTGMPAGGGRIYVHATPPTTWSGSPLYPEGSGSGQSWITMHVPDTGHVDGLLVRMEDSEGNILYSEDLEVSYDYRPVSAPVSSWGAVKSLFD